MNVGGCILQAEPLNQFDKVTMTFIRLLFPIWFAYLMITVAFRIGVKKKRDRSDPLIARHIAISPLCIETCLQCLL